MWEGGKVLATTFRPSTFNLRTFNLPTFIPSHLHAHLVDRDIWIQESGQHVHLNSFDDCAGLGCDDSFPRIGNCAKAGPALSCIATVLCGLICVALEVASIRGVS